MSDESRWLSTSQAAQLLGVKTATIYAYVSRGQLTRHVAADRRSSRFERAEVQRLAARTRRGGRAGSLDVVLDTELSLLEPTGSLYYRGHDAVRLARDTSYEQVAALLWSGTTPVPGQQPEPWECTGAALAAGRSAQQALPAATRPADRLRVTAAVVAGTDPLRHDRRPGAVVTTGQALIAALADCLPRRHEPADRTIAARLWAALAPTAPEPAQLRALNAALVLTADHELASSALASRVAAAVWADPYLTVLAGLATAGGVLHGGAMSEVESLLTELAHGRSPADLVAARLAGPTPVPGFGHHVYTRRDPRSDALRALVDEAGGADQLAAAAEELVALVGRHDGPPPNVDFALGLLAARAGLTAGAAEAVFLMGRSAGLIGHTIEEYRHRFRFRPRAVYTGPAPETVTGPR